MQGDPTVSTPPSKAGAATMPARPHRQKGRRALTEHDDHDGAFAGSPEELEALLEDSSARAAEPGFKRWRVGMAFLFGAGVSVVLWAAVLLLLW